ncbi:MAG: hypothetical protein IJ022_04705 [Burkholderiaceae bacterium]|nr:hypothetical protein [Burkholderiaceae bacterium]
MGNIPPNLVNVTRWVYILHSLSILIGVFTGVSIATAFVFGWPSIIAVVINYVKRSDAKGTYLESHFIWQIKTFWFAFFWIVLVWLIGMALSVILVGFAIWFVGFIVLSIWVCYRIVKGWLRLSEARPMYD